MSIGLCCGDTQIGDLIIGATTLVYSTLVDGLGSPVETATVKWSLQSQPGELPVDDPGIIDSGDMTWDATDSRYEGEIPATATETLSESVEYYIRITHDVAGTMAPPIHIKRIAGYNYQ